MKVEKYPGEGSEIVPETISLQAVEGLYSEFIQRMANRVPFD